MRIEGMAKAITLKECYNYSCKTCPAANECQEYNFAKAAYSKHYRNMDEVIDEFVEQLKILLHRHEHRSRIDGTPFYCMNAESFCDEIDELANRMRED